MDHFFHCDLGLKCLNRRMLENSLKQIAMRDSILLNDVIFIQFSNKKWKKELERYFLP